MFGPADEHRSKDPNWLDQDKKFCKTTVVYIYCNELPQEVERWRIRDEWCFHQEEHTSDDCYEDDVIHR